MSCAPGRRRHNLIPLRSCIHPEYSPTLLNIDCSSHTSRALAPWCNCPPKGRLPDTHPQHPAWSPGKECRPPTDTWPVKKGLTLPGSVRACVFVSYFSGLWLRVLNVTVALRTPHAAVLAQLKNRQICQRQARQRSSLAPRHAIKLESWIPTFLDGLECQLLKPMGVQGYLGPSLASDPASSKPRDAGRMRRST